MRTRVYWQRLSVYVFCIALSLFCVKVWAEWIPGIIHIHTTFSDGSDNIPQRVARAKKEGCRFIIITDHYDQIASVEKSGKWAGRDYGFEDYFRNCQEQTNAEFVTIAGAEIESLWMPEKDAERSAHSHILALRIKPEDHPGWKINQEIEKIQCQMDTQLAVAEKVRDLGWIPVAAHPNLITTKSFPRFWEWQDNRFDFRSRLLVSTILHGFEMFNVETDKQHQDLVEQYLKKEGRYVFVTSGCDSHGWHEPKDDDRWTRKTWVNVDDLSQEGILVAIDNGKTYAAQYGASLKNLNYIPGFKAQTVDRPKFEFVLAFNRATSSPKIIRVYRSGELVRASIREYPAGAQEYRYSWEDQEAKAETYSYIIEVADVLITSPIVLNIRGSSGAILVQSGIRTVPQIFLDYGILGNYVVGRDNKEDIYCYDINKDQLKQIGTGRGGQFRPAISNDKIVWVDTRNGRGDIYLHDLNTGQERMLCQAFCAGTDLSISGDLVVWVDQRTGSSEVFLFDLKKNESRRISGDGNNKSWLKIDGQYIVWGDQTSWRIWVHDLASGQTKEITKGFLGWQPSISNGRVAWLGMEKYVNYLGLMDLKTGEAKALCETSSTFRGGGIRNLDFSGNLIAWIEDAPPDSTSYQVCIYDLAINQKKIIMEKIGSYWIAVSDNRVVCGGKVWIK